MVSFGLFLNCGAQIGRSDDEVFELVLEEARLAECLGYHDVWIAEHHFIPFGINPSALTLAAFLLGQTSRLRVGTAVTLAPLYHPLQLAEQAALLDQCSGGRFDFGIGRGGYLAEFETFGIDPARWSDEVECAASILLDAWRKKEVSAQNRWATFAPVSINPRPRTRPHPPLFLASTTPSTVAFAAANQVPLLHYWGTPLEARIATERLYAETASDPVDHVHALVVIVADDEAATQAALAEKLKQSFRDGDWPHVPQARNRHVGPDGQPIARDKLAEFVAQHALVGSPERICRGLQEISSKLGAQRFILFMEAIADRDRILASIERFAREVMRASAKSRPSEAAGSPTRRQCRCSIPGAAGPGPASCGPTPATTGRGPAAILGGRLCLCARPHLRAARSALGRVRRCPPGRWGAYRKLASGGAVELAFCWAHVRRNFYELQAAGTPAPIASEALARIAGLYAVSRPTSAARSPSGAGRGASGAANRSSRRSSPGSSTSSPWSRARPASPPRSATRCRAGKG